MIRCVLLALLLTLTACSDARVDIRVGPSAPVDAPLPPDANLRPVPVPGGDGFAYLRPEPAAQALCHALDPRAWAEAAEGPVTREVLGGVDDARCTVRTTLLEIRIEADAFSSIPRGEPDRRVADFPVWIDLRTLPTAAVGFLDPDFDRRPIHQTDARAVIEITVAQRHSANADVGLERILGKVTDALVPRLRVAGPDAPPRSDHDVPLTPTDPPDTPVRDLPLPQATAVVCTSLTEKLRLRPDQVTMRVASLGHCRMADVEVSVFRFWAELKGDARTVAGQSVREGRGHAFGDPGGRAWAAVVIAEQPFHAYSDGSVPEIIAVSASGDTDPGPLVDHLATTLRLR